MRIWQATKLTPSSYDFYKQNRDVANLFLCLAVDLLPT